MHDPLEFLVKKCEGSVRSVLEGLGAGAYPVSFDTPPDGLGDIAFPCFRLSRVLGRKPAEIASEIAASASIPGLASAEAAGPYVNFRFDACTLAKLTLEIALGVQEYGVHPPISWRVILEHTSANPTDRLHVGRGRNPIIGDTLARLLRMAGYEVETQYYVDDMGRQAAMRLLAERYGESYKRIAGLLECEISQDTEELRRELEMLVKDSERGNAALLREMRETCARVMEENIVPILQKIDALPERFVNESQFVVNGDVTDVLEALRASNQCREEHGALYMDLAEHGVSGRDTRFFLTRSDGTSLYPARDVAYHVWKLARCDRAINILGEDHKLESKGVEAALRALGHAILPEAFFYAFVGLPEGKMSTRRGRVVYLDDLVEEAVVRARTEVDARRPELSEERRAEIAEAVGVAAVRYNIIRVQPDKPIVFRWEDALNFEGNSAPFVMYAHARACSILSKSEGAGDHDPALLRVDTERRLVRRIAALPSTIKRCAAEMSPHLLASYAFALAADFNQFYRDCPVLSAAQGLRSARLALVQAARNAMRSTLRALGIKALEEM